MTALGTPALLHNLSSGYDASALRRDMLAGLTVAIVALPLSMAIAIASHATPQAGLTTAIVGGFVISAFGGSRYQIGGPAGAFIVLVASIIDRHGMAGLLATNLMAGVIMVALGVLRLGRFVRHVPHAVIAGFTAAIGAIVFASQIHDFLGLRLPGAEPAAIVEKMKTLSAAWHTLNLWAAAIAVLSVLVIAIIRRWFPRQPAFLIAVSLCTFLVFARHLDVETIASRFGTLPAALPWPTLPHLDLAYCRLLLPDAIAIALLGSVESLLSAMVADGMSGEKHSPNVELVAQGVANVGVAVFAGITATGTIARTATNVRAGAHGPLSGMFHAAYILLFMLVAAPLLGFIPLAALAGVLVVVSFGMVEWRELGSKFLSSRQNATVLVLTFGITIFEDLLSGIIVGTAVWWLAEWWKLRNKARPDAMRP